MRPVGVMVAELVGPSWVVSFVDDLEVELIGLTDGWNIRGEAKRRIR